MYQHIVNVPSWERSLTYGYTCEACGRVVSGITAPRHSCQRCLARVDCRPEIAVTEAGRAALAQAA